MSKTTELELTLDTKQCAEVALMMYREWQKAMQPPLFIYKYFDEWLEMLLEKPTPHIAIKENKS